ncbi:ECF transporter S component [Weissella ceti]|uniref:ECF transporter S component n=1 Tax=Weissella ceti TaxID=759620 RepID=A0ABT3E3E6_9LACO|nr:ECF transporter S component [Weissella ceti]MCW0952934.1 ECF transporter S component [Weissella ceti]QVK11480.1 ECF transporter S component [Weissella ceti]
MKIKQLTLLSMFVALNVALSVVVKVPTPTGFVSLVEAGIFIAAWRYGRASGMLVGGLTGLLLDLLAGYPQWMIFSLLIHGAEGWLVDTKATRFKRVWSLVIALVVVVGGYWFAGGLLMWLMAGMNMSLVTALIAALAEIPLNIVQVFVGWVVAQLLMQVLEKQEKKIND